MLRKIHQSLLQKKGCFADETNRISQANSDPYKSNLNEKTGSFIEVSSSEEEDVGMRKIRRKIDFDNTNKESNGNIIEEEEIKLPKFGRKGDVKNVN